MLIIGNVKTAPLNGVFLIIKNIRFDFKNLLATIQRVNIKLLWFRELLSYVVKFGCYDVLVFT